MINAEIRIQSPDSWKRMTTWQVSFGPSLRGACWSSPRRHSTRVYTVFIGILVLFLLLRRFCTWVETLMAARESPPNYLITYLIYMYRGSRTVPQSMLIWADASNPPEAAESAIPVRGDARE
ncbi:hypothetical protein SODALDRAFT_138027 [Sodiomyces alkalinus F11]|uniref:Uncharacterized protein n=1 Tax=Sodiomyces alkalinus (strain CBS 110278 / VKM F-3762 / F11) TaxID=1314773 RepID=A0A3N2PZ34_SODAK|nr:hypothetical protein SODALDRAFT_138027 [Sodiomyces alkalinus F11]ROT39789.1 hypothetical protein SODALDRAFT_138027 [Sodiomyces alkalinus F11]